MNLSNSNPLVNIPMVRVVNAEGKELKRGYYFRWVTRQPAAIEDWVKSEDIKECVVYSGFADWNMPRNIEYMIVEPPNHIEIIETENMSNKNE